MFYYKMKPIWVAFLLLALLCKSLIADEARPKHVLVAYDHSRSMSYFWDKRAIERINEHLIDLLFEGTKEESVQDEVLLHRETPLFGKDLPLLEPGDRLSFIRFGGPPIPDPELGAIYDGSLLLKEELTKRLPRRKGELIGNWTCLELLYWKVSQVFREHPQFHPNLRVLISDRCESRYPLNLEDQRRILWYKDLYKEEILLDIKVGAVHLEVAEIVPPISGIEIIGPRPGKEEYFASRPLLLQVQVIKEGTVLKEEGWEVKAEIWREDGADQTSATLYDDGSGEDELAGDGIYTGVFLSRRGGETKILFKAAKGSEVFQSDLLRLTLLKPHVQPYWLYGIILLFIGLFIYYRLSLLRFWVEREGFGGPPRQVELKRMGDILFLGKREEESYIDLGLSQYSLLREKGRQIVLWREGREEGEIVHWGRWFSPRDEEELTLRFSISKPKRGAARPGIPKAEQKTKGDFYKW